MGIGAASVPPQGVIDLDVNTPIIPVNGVTHYLKNLFTVASGAADTDQADKLIDSGATFITAGVEVGTYVYNSTDSTWAIVASVDSETQITLRADLKSGSVVTDLFPLGSENYVIYNTPELAEGMVELNGQALTGALAEPLSRHNGLTMPNINGGNYFLRAATTSGTTGGSATHNHTATASPDSGVQSGGGATVAASSHTHTISTVNSEPPYYEAVYVMRIY